MITMKPLTIRAAQLTSSTVPFPDTGETAWSSATVSYAVGNTVSYETGGLIRKYECKTAHTSNASNFPVPYPNETANWLDLGAANRYRMFHLEHNSYTSGASPLIVEITPGIRFGAVGISKVVADDVLVELYDGSSLVYSKTQSLVARKVSTWSNYFIEEFINVPGTVLLDLPIMSTSKLKLTFTREAGNVQVGFVVLGVPQKLGETQYKARARSLNFTTVDRDAFGNAKVNVVRNVPKTVQQLWITRQGLDSAVSIIQSLDGVVTLWTALSNPLDGFFNTLFIIGFCRDIEYNMDYPDAVFATIELEGV